MNKYLFWILTLVLTLVLVFAANSIELNYLLSDKYIETEMAIESYKDGHLSINEFKEKVENGDTIDQENYPYEFIVASASSFLMRTIMIVVVALISLAVRIIIKGKKIRFSVLIPDVSNKRINTVRIVFYILAIISIYFSFNTYPTNFMMGWVHVLLVLVSWIVGIVWVLNISYSIIENRENKMKKTTKV